MAGEQRRTRRAQFRQHFAALTDEMGAGRLMAHTIGEAPEDDAVLFSHPEEPRLFARHWPRDDEWFVLSTDTGASSGNDLAARRHDPALAGLYSQALVGMVAQVGQWWLARRSPSKQEVAAHLVDLAYDGLAHLRPSAGRRPASGPLTG